MKKMKTKLEDLNVELNLRKKIGDDIEIFITYEADEPTIYKLDVSVCKVGTRTFNNPIRVINEIANEIERLISYISSKLVGDCISKFTLSTYSVREERIYEWMLKRANVPFTADDGEFIIDVPKCVYDDKIIVDNVTAIINVENIDISIDINKTEDNTSEVLFARAYTGRKYDELIGFKNPVKSVNNIIGSIMVLSELFVDNAYYIADDKRKKLYERLMDRHGGFKYQTSKGSPLTIVSFK